MGGLRHGEVGWDKARRSSAPVHRDFRRGNSRMLERRRAVRPQNDEGWPAPPRSRARLEVNDMMTQAPTPQVEGLSERS